MSIKQCKIYTLENESKNFSLSAYSRRFSWDSERIKELFMKIKNAFEGGRELFLGSVLLYEEDEGYKILDGGHRIALVGALLERLEGSKQFDKIIQEAKEMIENFTISNPKAFARFLRNNVFFALTELSPQSNFADVLLKGQTTRKQLQKTDILKARLFSQVPQMERYGSLWSDCERVCIGGKVDFSYFLLYALYLLDNSIEIRKSKILEIFEKNLNNKEEEFFEMMGKLKQIFASYLPKKDQQGRWKLEGEGKEIEKKAEYIKLLSYLLIAHNHRAWLREFVVFVIEKNPDDLKCIAYLEGLDNRFALAGYQTELGGYVKNQERMCKTLREWGFLNRGVEASHYWFYRLDYYLYKNREKYRDIRIGEKSFVEIAESYEFERLNSIEHIQPQSRAKEGDWSKKSKNIFGNLALISQNFNSSLNAKSVKEKKKQIIKQIKEEKTQSLKMVLAYAEIKDVWSLQMAEEHQNKMIKILEDSLP